MDSLMALADIEALSADIDRIRARIAAIRRSIEVSNALRIENALLRRQIENLSPDSEVVWLDGVIQ
tara:strand:- start:13 stop:210 length:198 start_codon:yes stop_codon:yes gene_type:complete